MIDRPFELLSLVKLLHWNACCVDDSALGAEALRVLSGFEMPTRVVQIGDEAPPDVVHVRVPLERLELLAAIGDPATEDHLNLNLERRAVTSEGREVLLTRTESRLLALLLERQPAAVSTAAVLREVWGYEEADVDPELVRTHVRNLRRKLGELGLPDAVQSQRGHGYRLVL
jgi:hypothetical protein